MSKLISRRALIGAAATCAMAPSRVRAQMPGTFIPVLSSLPAATFVNTLNNYSGDSPLITSKTYTNVPIGDEAPDRIIIATGLSYLSLSSITIDGTPMTIYGAAGGLSNGIAVLRYPTGTTATFIMTPSGASRLYLSVHAVYGLASVTPIDIYEDVTSGVKEKDFTIKAVAGGFIIGARIESGAGHSSHTWTGLTEEYDQHPSGSGATSNFTGAALLPTTTTDIFTGSCVSTLAGANDHLIVMSFR